jgi:hypothetical protein
VSHAFSRPGACPVTVRLFDEKAGLQVDEAQARVTVGGAPGEGTGPLRFLGAASVSIEGYPQDTAYPGFRSLSNPSATLQVEIILSNRWSPRDVERYAGNSTDHKAAVQTEVEGLGKSGRQDGDFWYATTCSVRAEKDSTTGKIVNNGKAELRLFDTRTGISAKVAIDSYAAFGEDKKTQNTILIDPGPDQAGLESAVAELRQKIKTALRK